MTDFEMVFMCLLIPVSFVMAYIAGKGDLLFVSCKMLEEKLEEYTNKEIEPNKNLDGWIPVEDRLPDKNEYVLIFDKNGRQYVWSLSESYGQYYWLDEHCEWVAFNEVVAWMPLPAPYDMRKKVGE